MERADGREYNIPIPYHFDGVQDSINYMSRELSKSYGKRNWYCDEIGVDTEHQSAREATARVVEKIQELTLH
jgi:hypothetical protein